MLRWDNALLSGLVASAVLRYLAVAHYGRGRGDWVETEYPPFWTPLVAGIVEEYADRLASLWAQREPVCDAANPRKWLKFAARGCDKGRARAALPGRTQGPDPYRDGAKRRNRRIALRSGVASRQIEI